MHTLKSHTAVATILALFCPYVASTVLIWIFPAGNLLCIFAGYAAHWRKDGWSLLVHLSVFLTPVAAVSACLIADFLRRDTAANDFGGTAIVLTCINIALCGFGFAVAHRTNARTG